MLDVQQTQLHRKIDRAHMKPIFVPVSTSQFGTYLLYFHLLQLVPRIDHMTLQDSCCLPLPPAVVLLLVLLPTICWHPLPHYEPFVLCLMDI